MNGPLNSKIFSKQIPTFNLLKSLKVSWKDDVLDSFMWRSIGSEVLQRGEGVLI